MPAPRARVPVTLPGLQLLPLPSLQIKLPEVVVVVVAVAGRQLPTEHIQATAEDHRLVAATGEGLLAGVQGCR